MESKEIKNNTEKPVMDGKEESLSEQKNESGQISNFTLFMKVGIIVLSIIAIIGFGIQILPNSVAVSTMTSKRVMPIYSVETDENKVALSFDEAYSNEDTQIILDILARNKVKATFFVTGSWVDQFPDDVKAIVAAGHDLGNHSENHLQMSLLTKEECIDEIVKTHEKVKELTGIEMNLFRAPYGDYSSTLVEAAKECGYDTIQWDVDSFDWKDYGADNILKQVTDEETLENGSIILMHDGAKYTPQALQAVITGLHAKGYELVPVSQLIYTGEYTVDETGRQFGKKK